MPNTITVKAQVNAPIETVWNAWTEPQHITQWNFAHESWQCPSAVNDVRSGGSFSWHMEAKDGSAGFDYSGQYVDVNKPTEISLVLDDGRKVDISFVIQADAVVVTETFEAETMNPEEMQRQGWQAILDNFKRYAESL